MYKALTELYLFLYFNGLSVKLRMNDQTFLFCFNELAKDHFYGEKMKFFYLKGGR